MIRIFSPESAAITLARHDELEMEWVAVGFLCTWSLHVAPEEGVSPVDLWPPLFSPSPPEGPGA